MKYPEKPTNTAALGASQAEFDRWNMYGEFTSEELYGNTNPTQPIVERLAPNVAEWDKTLRFRDLSHQLVASQVLGKEL